jgi:two-component system, LytTR family, response regulator
MLTALIVDDEANNIENLQFLLENDCTGIKVIGTAHNGKQAREWLMNHQVDVVFLDISMPVETGIEMLQKLTSRAFSVIFVTAHNEYALQAIKASAVDYLLKPVSIDELQQAVDKVKTQLNIKENSVHQEHLVKHLLQNFDTNTKPKRLAIPQLGGVSFIDVDEIAILQADSNYTIIHKNDMRKMVVTKTLKDFEDIIDEDQFIRVHKSHIVNLKYVKEYSTADGGTVKMIDGSNWSISRRQLDLFLQKMKAYNVLFFN